MSLSRETRAPYPGLRAFGREEADLFFGRDGAVDQMVDTLEETRFLAVLGSSGAGKSSLVLTGLLDGLELGLHTAGSDWTDCVFTPGGRPFTNLATALCQLGDESQLEESEFRQRVELLETFLRRGPHSLKEWWEESNFEPGRQLLLVVDQFEELFRFEGYSDRENAEAFSKLLIETSLIPDLPIHVVITMRSEFLGACALIPGLAETINKGAYLTPRMDRAGYREAIIGPAKMMNVSLDDALVARILRDIVSFAPWGSKSEDDDQLKRLSRRADQLPVMQHLMNRLWQIAANRPGDEVHITLADYEEIGGLRGALDAHGAEIMSSFSAREQIIVGRVFRALVDGNSIATATRRPQSVQELIAATETSQAELTRLIDRFRSADCNFLRPSVAQPLELDTVIDISHESLIRQWSRLSDWVTEEARAASLWSRLAEAAELHRTGEGDLLHGLTLSNLSTWWEEDKPSRAWSERYPGDYDEVSKFLEASRKEERREIAEDEEEDRIQRNRLLMGFGVVSVLAVVATVLAFALYVLQSSAINRETLSVAEFTRLVDGVFDANLSSAELSRSIQERDEALERMYELYSNNSQFIQMQTEFALKATQAMSEAWWFSEAEQHASLLKERIDPKGSNRTWTVPPEFQFEAQIALANLSYHRGKLADQAAYLDAAEMAFEASDFDEPNRIFFEIEMVAARIAHHDAKHEFQLRQGLLVRMNELLNDLIFMHDTSSSIADAFQIRGSDAFEQYQSRLGRALNRGLAANRTALLWLNDQMHLEERFPDEYQSYSGQVQIIDNFAVKNLSQKRPEWSELQRELEHIRAGRLEDEDEQIAFDHLNEAVRHAYALYELDPTNQYYRYVLETALIGRARMATELQMFVQASIDLDRAQSLQDTMQLERRFLPAYLEQGTNLIYRRHSLYEENSLPNSDGESSEAAFDTDAADDDHSGQLRLLARLENHLDFYSARSESPASMSQLWTILAWMAFAPKTWELLDESESARIITKVLAEVSYAESDEFLAYLAKVQRRYLAIRVSQGLQNRLDDERFVEFVQESLAEGKGLPDVEFWQMSQSYLHLNVGDYFAFRGNQRAAASNFSAAIDYLVSSETLYGEQSFSVRNSVYALLVTLDERGFETLDAAALQQALVLAKALDKYPFDPVVETNLRSSIRRAGRYLEWLQQEPTRGEEHEPLALELEQVLKDLLATWDPETFSRWPGISDAPQGDEIETIINLRRHMTEIETANDSYRAWFNPTIYSSTWWTLSETERDEFRGRFLDKYGLDESWFDSVIFVRKTELPFYDEVDLIEFERVESGRKAIYPFLISANSLTFLDGNSQPIHDANDRFKFSLNTRQEASAYLRFFCSYLTAKEGAFLILDNVQDLVWLPSATYEDMASVEKKIQPLAIWRSEKEGKTGWSATVVMQYSDAIFHAEMFVSQNGDVDMVNDRPILTDLPIHPIATLDRRPSSTTDIVQVDLTTDKFPARDAEYAWIERVSACLRNQRCNHRDDLVDYFGADVSDDRRYTLSSYDEESKQAQRIHPVARSMMLAQRVPDTTVRMAAKAVDLDPSSVQYKSTYAAALLQTGQYALALEQANACVADKWSDADKNNSATLAECLFLKGRALVQMGQVYAAVPAFAEAERYGVPEELLTLFDPSSSVKAVGNE